MLVHQVQIKPAASGFGQWEAYGESESYEDLMDDADILNGVSGEVYELGSEDLPEWVEDIRGLIANEPERVFVEKSNDGLNVYYFGFNNA
jgi:hypothetical protein